MDPITVPAAVVLSILNITSFAISCPYRLPALLMAISIIKGEFVMVPIWVAAPVDKSIVYKVDVVASVLAPYIIPDVGS